MKKWLIIVPGIVVITAITVIIANRLSNKTTASISQPQQPAPVAPAAVDQTSTALFNVDSIAGKPPEAVAEQLGQPTATEQINPSDTPCPCTKNTYSADGTVIDVIYINGKADWLTVYLQPQQIDAKGSYVLTESSPTYTFIKVATP